jgi:hypothetical protein
MLPTIWEKAGNFRRIIFPRIIGVKYKGGGAEILQWVLSPREILQNLLSLSNTSTVDSGSTGGGRLWKKISVRGERPASHPNLPIGLPNYCLHRAPTCLLEALSPGQIEKHCFAKIFVILFVLPMFRYVILSYQRRQTEKGCFIKCF